MKIEGRVWKFGDHVDTDLIIPARFLNTSESNILARHCFADLRPDFARKAAQGDIIVAGRNFGCGSSREHAPLALKAAGIRLIIAHSFARIFYRNAFNIGLPLLESEDAAEVFSEGDLLSVDLSSGVMRLVDKQRELKARPIPGFMMEMVRQGGLVAHIRHRGFH